MLAERILEHYTDIEKTREWKNPIRMSSAGKCARAIAYQLYFKDKLKPLTGRAILLFRLGDLVESDMVEVSRMYGLINTQEEVRVKIADREIIGHIDGELKDKNMIVDFKSCSDYAFSKALKNDVDYGYKCQMHCYMQAKGYKQALVVYYKKQTSHLTEVIVNWDDNIWGEVIERFKQVFQSSPENLPPREYKEDTKTNKLPWQCSYCSACELCWPNRVLTFDKQGRPILTIKGGNE